ncbi:ergothioneine biosynthesis glutamate--cysteine ligase EgtA [Speluncibacter jeojiensis]|uniref:Glutamate--cysteine ligase EgtA n=1 Tax=Speluncibacter jeojiensis TaxID=2710754 RepID=A0A9X4RE34_9ACTN|nr:ergothioneine biosynthesis glutamate--cysteine ligase EgtA [Corynebacteriales bacterium D3-21]
MALAVDSPALTSRAAAEAYIGGVCFKLGPPELVGAELEWLTACPGDDLRRPSPQRLAGALGQHAPTSVAPESPAIPLPGGSAVTVEPGGQIELSSAPHASVRELCTAMSADSAELMSLLRSAAIAPVPGAADRERSADRILQHPRYAAMEQLFTKVGPFGKLMMCNTAAVQVSVDAGIDRAQARRRWQLLNAIGPALVAAFADSPRLCGAPGDEWASQRMRTWLELDRDRTRAPEGSPVPVADYAAWSLDVPLLCVVGSGSSWAAPEGASFADWIDGALDDELGREPTTKDLDYHLTTLFPPVRARGHLEVRYLDAQPGDGWRVPIAVVAALTSSEAVAEQALSIADGTVGQWRTAARRGLCDGELRGAAVQLLELAAAHAEDAGFAGEIGLAAARCRRRLSPSQERNR